MAAMMGGEAAAVVEAPAAEESRAPEEMAVEVVSEVANAAVAAAAMAMAVAVAFEAGGRPTIAMKNPLL